MEWIYRPSWDSIGESAQILAHQLFHHYSAPDGFDFDKLSDNSAAQKDGLLKKWCSLRNNHGHSRADSVDLYLFLC